ncbi:hypothetical protein [Streptomyces flaveolus]|uniref:hypothetical protein n=1 Tax=Streptomyces flaveolus TaxID=67297 RepID=UPI0034195F23
MTIALGALVLMLALAAGALLSRKFFVPHILEQETDLAGLLRPQAVEVNDHAWCPAEERLTLHGFHRDNSRTCWTCRTRTSGGAA